MWIIIRSFLADRSIEIFLKEVYELPHSKIKVYLTSST